MAYKMKGFTYPGKSPLKQEEKKKKVPGSDWNMDDYLVDGKPAKEIIKENREKERQKWILINTLPKEDWDEIRKRQEKAKKKSPAKHIKLNKDSVSVKHKHPDKKPPKPKWIEKEFPPRSPAKQKSTESAHGQLNDAEREYQDDLKTEKRKFKRDHIGKPYMRPPYKDTASGTRPYEKRQGYHGFKEFESIIPQFQNKNKTKK